MADDNLQENDSFSVLALTFTADMKWEQYIKAIAMSAAKKIALLCRATHLFTRQNLS